MVRADETQHSGSMETMVKEINRRQDVEVPQPDCTPEE